MSILTTHCLQVDLTNSVCEIRGIVSVLSLDFFFLTDTRIRLEMFKNKTQIISLLES